MPEERDPAEAARELSEAEFDPGPDTVPAGGRVAEPQEAGCAVTRICEGLIEAGWLTALVVTPLLFNIYSKQVFEPDKATILRILASVQALAWVVKATASKEAWRQELRRLRRFPLLVPIAAVMSSYLLSSFFSVAPRLSWLGTYERREGSFTLLACLVIFVMTATHLRRHSQLNRLLFAVILTSVPVSAYAIAQFFDVDPLPWGEYFRSQAGLRVTSTLGNPIFLGAFLLLPSFVVLGWAVHEGSTLRPGSADPRGTSGKVFLVTAATLALGTQWLALFLTSSRGPLLGLLGGFYFVLTTGSLLARTMLIRRSRIRLAQMALAFGAVLLVAGLFLPLVLAGGLAGSPPKSTKETGRLDRLLRLDSPTVRVRTILWETVPRILASDEPLRFPGGGRDTFHPLRPWIGYGPETFAHAFSRHYPAELGRFEKRRARPDRAHNEPLHILVTRGWLGLLTYLFLAVEILRKSAQWIGLTSSRREERILRFLLLATASVAAVVFWLLAPAFLGFGVLWGLLLGCAIWWCFFARPAGQTIAPSSWFLLACLAALVSHWVETQTGFPITSSSLYFWMVCAVLVASGERPELLQAQEPAARSTGEGQNNGIELGLLASLALVTLCFDFVGNWNRSDSALARALQWITGGPVSNWLGTLPNLFLILLLTWTIGAILLLCAAGVRERQSRWRGGVGDVLTFSLFSLGPAYLFLSVQALYPAAVRILPGEADIERQLLFQHYQIRLFLIALATFWVLAALILSHRRAAPGRTRPAGLLRPLMTVVVSVVLAAWVTAQGMQTIRADVLVKQAEGAAAVGRDDLSEAYLEEMSLLRPSEGHYQTVKGTLELKKAGQISDIDQRQRLYERSRESLEKAQSVDPLSVTAAENLAVLYRTRARTAGDPADRMAQLEKARDYLQQALRLSPNLVYLHNEVGAVWMASGDQENAKRAYERSLELDDSYQTTYLALGILERLQAEMLIQGGDPEAARVRYREAVTVYESLLRLNPRSEEAHSALAFLRWQLGQVEPSIQEHLEVLRLQPRNLRSHRRLAEIYFDLERFEDSLRHVRLGLEIAPADPALQELNTRLSALPEPR